MQRERMERKAALPNQTPECGMHATPTARATIIERFFVPPSFVSFSSLSLVVIPVLLRNSISSAPNTPKEGRKEGRKEGEIEFGENLFGLFGHLRRTYSAFGAVSLSNTAIIGYCDK